MVPGARRLFVGQGEAAHDHQREIELRLHFVGVRGQQSAHAFDERFFGILGIGIAARGDGGDVQFLEVGGLAGYLAQFDGFLGGNPRARSGGRHGLSEEGAERIDLEARAPVAGSHHRDAPLRHRRGGVERGGLQEAALGFARPEGVHLRDALIEELLRFRAGGGDREVDGAHAGQEFRGQGRREGARRRRAIVGRLWAAGPTRRVAKARSRASFIGSPVVAQIRCAS